MKSKQEWAEKHFFGIVTRAGAEDLVGRIQIDALEHAARILNWEGRTIDDCWMIIADEIKRLNGS